MKKYLRFLAACAALALAACGGGSDDPAPTAPAPAPVPPVVVEPPPVAKPADVAITQLDSSLVLLPGERAIVSKLRLDCAGAMPNGECPYPRTDLGQILVNSEKVLFQNLKFILAGNEIAGSVTYDAAKRQHRFVPYNRTTVIKNTVLEVAATVSPYAQSGEFSVLVLTTTSTAPDLTVSPVAGGQASVTVLAQPEYAPMTIDSSPAYLPIVNEKGGAPTVWNFVATCAPETYCSAPINFGWLQDLVPGTSVEVCDDSDSCWTTAWVDENGYAYLEIYVGWWSQNYQVRLFPAATEGRYGLEAGLIEADVGGRKIAPKIGSDTAPSTACLAVSQNSECKG